MAPLDFSSQRSLTLLLEMAAAVDDSCMLEADANASESRDQMSDYEDCYGQDDSIAAATRLSDMPHEIFMQVCGHLDAIWLWNLSHACRATFHQLNGSGANSLWYKAMPPSIWGKKERYQDEYELMLWRHESTSKPAVPNYFATPALLKDTSMPVLKLMSPPRSKGLIPGREVMDSTMGDSTDLAGLLESPRSPLMTPSSFESSVFGFDFENDSYIGSAGPSPTSSFGNVSPEAMHQQAMILHQYDTRKKVTALGGPYQKNLNYRREIIGRVMTMKRCFLCLNYRYYPDKTAVSNDRFGVLWCDRCLQDWTISLAAVTSMFTWSRVEEYRSQSYYRDPSVRRLMKGGQIRYFRPEIDAFFRQRGYGDISIVLNDHKLLHSYERRLGMTRSRIQPVQRNIRRRIVAAAQSHWEGIDPAPRRREDPISKRWMKSSRMDITPERFKMYRERFAPTSTLADVLFAPELLAEWPLNARTCDDAAGSATGYLPDPTTAMWSADGCTDDWISHQAEMMLLRLTDWKNPLYYYKGYGGYHKLWLDAARKYHTKRLQASLDAGKVFNAPAVGLRYLPTRPGQFMPSALREKLGFDPEHLVNDYQTYNYLAPQPGRSKDWHFQAEQSAFEKERRKKSIVKHFNKIIEKTCKRCPLSQLLFVPKGIDGLLAHMRGAHPQMFWETDDFEIFA